MSGKPNGQVEWQIHQPDRFVYILVLRRRNVCPWYDVQWSEEDLLVSWLSTWAFTGGITTAPYAPLS